MLTVCNISYKTRFTGLGFSLTPGALLAVYGADSSGLLMLLAGKLSPTTGTITFEDAGIKKNREYHDLTLYIEPTYKFGSWEKVETAVARLAKKGGGEKELVEATLRYWGLTDKRSMRCNELPPHLQKRIILTQLLTLPRPIWLLDSAESELDAEGLALLDAVIANRCNQSGIVVFGTKRQGFMAPLPALHMSDFS